MKPSDAILGKRQTIREAVESYGFVDVRIFGSVCRGEDREGSDLALLVTIPAERAGKISLFDIMDLESKLKEMLGIPVDMNVANNMPDHLKPFSYDRAMRPVPWGVGSFLSKEIKFFRTPP